jgi:hypothetical protein
MLLQVAVTPQVFMSCGVGVWKCSREEDKRNRQACVLIKERGRDGTAAR